MPEEGKKLYWAELVTLTPRSDILFEFLVTHIQTGMQQKLWVMITGVVLLEELPSGRMKKIESSDNRLAGPTLVTGKSIQEGAILNAAGSAWSAYFKNKQARKDLNNLINRLQRRHVGMIHLTRKAAQHGPDSPDDETAVR